MALAKTTENQDPAKTGKHKRSATAKSSVPCPYSHEPNEETKQALREADAGIGLTTYKTVDDLRRILRK